MNNFKKGFTMVELIFVIVILGILAAVVIPKLAATRDDAEIAKFAQNLSTLITDIASYRTSQGKYETKISDMTNVGIINTEDYKAELKIRNDSCAEIIVYNEDDKPKGIRGGMFEIKTKNSNSKLCKMAMDLPSVTTYLKGGKGIFLGEKVTH